MLLKQLQFDLPRLLDIYVGCVFLYFSGLFTGSFCFGLFTGGWPYTQLLVACGLYYAASKILPSHDSTIKFISGSHLVFIAGALFELSSLPLSADIYRVQLSLGPQQILAVFGVIGFLSAFGALLCIDSVSFKVKTTWYSVSCLLVALFTMLYGVYTFENTAYSSCWQYTLLGHIGADLCPNGIK